MAEITVILAEVIGEHDSIVVVMDVPSESERSIIGPYWNAVGWMLEGGSSKHSYQEYVDRVESFEGTTVSGVITHVFTPGYDHLIGETLNGEPLETDVEALSEIASGLDFSQGPYEYQNV